MNKRRLSSYIINARNQTVTKQLEATYGVGSTQSGLKIFCVSNSIYWKHRESALSARISECLQLSGIIDLRRHCLSIVSKAQLSAAMRYINCEVPAVVAHIRLWAESVSSNWTGANEKLVADAINSVKLTLLVCCLSSIQTSLS
jgi:hypothetical protein